jgi:hypothetical protein
MRLLGKFGMTACAAVVMALAATSSASAATILVANFCFQGSSCPTGLTEASLTISDIPGGDVNDYNIVARFTGTSAAPALLDMFSFTIDGVKTQSVSNGYTSVALNSATSKNNTTSVVTTLNTGDFQTVYDNVSNQANACTTNTYQANEVCTNTLNSTGLALAGNTLTFNFLVNLSDTFLISATNGLNLRANFNPNGILSPGGRYVNGDGVEINPTGVPEPASMVLFGLAALAGARRVRRR